MNLLIQTERAEETQSVAKHVGERLRGGEVIELVSDVGGGKTTFVRGLAAGAGSNDHVSSPTFTISKIYTTNQFDIVHFDFYRLQEAGLIEHEIEEALDDSLTVVVVEWSDVVKHVLPEQRLTITIEKANDTARVFELEFPDEYSYLTEGHV